MCLFLLVNLARLVVRMEVLSVIGIFELQVFDFVSISRQVRVTLPKPYTLKEP